MRLLDILAWSFGVGRTLLIVSTPTSALSILTHKYDCPSGCSINYRFWVCITRTINQSDCISLDLGNRLAIPLLKSPGLAYETRVDIINFRFVQKQGVFGYRQNKQISRQLPFQLFYQQLSVSLQNFGTSLELCMTPNNK
jgi:hypothetical protein